MKIRDTKHAVKKAELVAYKGGICMDCKHVFPDCCFDFDHRDPFQKSYGIGEKITGRITVQELKLEVDKCDLVCANCHRIRTTTSALIRQRASIGHRGQIVTPEHRKKLSDANKGKTHSEEHNAKVSAALKGQVLSMETRMKISDTLKRKGIRPTREQCSLGGRTRQGIA
jgi:hypothetical protein